MLDGLDEFWRRKYETFLGRDAGANDFVEPEARASRAAWQWVMIALTRPIDTLVITLRDKESEVAKVIDAVARSHGDFIEWID